jgi:F-type H+-transporting ATPase subunit epsilon
MCMRGSARVGIVLVREVNLKLEPHLVDRLRFGYTPVMSFKCVVVTPEQQVLDETVSQVILPAHDGLIGILTDRAPLLVKLGVGEMRVTPTGAGGGKDRVYLVDGGVAQMKDNNLTVLTQHATAASALDSETAKAALAEATARRITDEKSFEQRQHDLQRAREMQHLAGKAGK